jgi:hypothetical protein
MPLLQQVRSILALPGFSYWMPILVLVCFLVSFRHWLHAKWYAAGAIYALSLFTYAVIKTVTQQPDWSALWGGILAPAFYSFLFVCGGIIRVLRSPYGFRMTAVPRSTPLTGLARLLRGAIGGCVGGITGSTLGAVFSFLLLLLFPLPSSGFSLSWQVVQTFDSLVRSSVLFCGTVGISLGLLIGWGYLNQKQLGDRFLVYLTIQWFLVTRLLKHLFCRKS